MNIQLLGNAIRLTPENQAEFFQLEILHNNKGDIQMMRLMDIHTGDLSSLDIKVLKKDDTDSK